MRISDWSSDVCSSDLALNSARSTPPSCPRGLLGRPCGSRHPRPARSQAGRLCEEALRNLNFEDNLDLPQETESLASNCGGPMVGLRPRQRPHRLAVPRPPRSGWPPSAARSEEHTSELQSLMRITY